MNDEWTDVEYGGCHRQYLNGLLTASISYAITGEKGYVARVGKTTLKKRFEYMEDAKTVLDILVKKRCIEYLATIDS